MGQDLNLAMDRVLSSRNFANKLWNAGKFILGGLDGARDAEWASLAAADFGGQGTLVGLPLAERWILSSLHQVEGSASTNFHCSN